MKNDKLIKIMVVLMIIILIIIVALLVILNNLRTKVEDGTIEKQTILQTVNHENIEFSETVAPVMVREDYYMVKNCIEDFIYNMQKENKVWLTSVLYDTELEELDRILPNIKEMKLLEISQLYIKQKNLDTMQFFANTVIGKEDYSVTENISFIMQIDVNNQTFLIKTYKDDTNLNEFSNMNFWNENISVIYGYNVYKRENYVEDLIVIQDYFSNFIYKVIYSTQQAYQMLNDKSKMEMLDEFKSNMLNKSIYIKEYSIEYSDNETIYNCIDNYNNKFKFIEKYINNYSVDIL